MGKGTVLWVLTGFFLVSAVFRLGAPYVMIAQLSADQPLKIEVATEVAKEIADPKKKPRSSTFETGHQSGPPAP